MMFLIYLKNVFQYFVFILSEETEVTSEVRLERYTSVWNTHIFQVCCNFTYLDSAVHLLLMQILYWNN
jgi:hypothetical protein